MNARRPGRGGEGTQAISSGTKRGVTPLNFMEAGKARMRGDTVREATGDEVKALRRENERLKQLVADLSVANLLLKKSQS